MKVLLYSDLHIYNHHRLHVNFETALSVLDFVKDFSVKNKINKVICAGDFFHTKSKAYAPHVVQSLSKIKEIKNSGIDHYMIIGNHDIASSNTTMNSILFVFSDYAKIIPDYYFIDIEDVRIHFLSYTDTYFDGFILSENKKNILVAHLDIIGFNMGNGFESTSGFKADYFKEFDLVFSGHYHEHQTRGNIVYIGSPYQTSFSEKEQKKGIIILETKDLTWDFVEILDTPKYKVIEISDLDQLNKEDVFNNFLRIKIKNKNIDKNSLKRKLLELGALSVDVILPEDYLEIKSTKSIDITNDPVELAEIYLKSIENLELDKKKLLYHFNKIQEVANNIADYEI